MTTNGTGAGSSDVVLGQDAETGQDVALGFAARPLGVAVIGQTGFGKTTLLEQLIRQDIEEGIACVVFDIEGGLSDRVLAFASTSRRLAKRVLLAEVGEGSAQQPFGVNLYECPDPTNEDLFERTVSGVVELLKRLWGEDLTRQPIVSRGIHNSARTIIANPGYTIAEVPLLFEEPALRRQLLANLPEADYPAVHRYWRHYANLREQDRELWSGATINKLEEFLSNRIVSRIVCQSRTTIPWRQLREEGCCLLLRFPQGVCGGETAATFLGSVFLSQLTQQVFAQGPGVSRLHLYLDEYGRFASPQTAVLLREGRQYNLGTTIAVQTLSSLKDQDNRSAALQLGSLVVFQVIGEDAKELAGQLDTTPVRKKQVLRQRTEPAYREWDEEVWPNEDTPKRLREAEELLEVARTRCNHTRVQIEALELGLFFDWQERLADHSLTAPVRLGLKDYATKTEDSEMWHSPFNVERGALNSRPEFLFSQAALHLEGPARSGPVRNGYAGLYKVTRRQRDGRVETATCEGYLAYYGWVYSRSPLWQGLRRYHTADTADCWRRPIIGELIEELQQVLGTRDYSEKTVRLLFEPGFDENGNPSQELAAWAERTRPQLGEERPDADWTKYGIWRMVLFPEAVKWLRSKARELLADQAEWGKQSDDLEAEVEQLVSQKRIVHRKEYLGEKSFKDVTVLRDAQWLYGRGGRYETLPVTKEEQWYDLVEELDQTHADRQLEVAKELATLDRFVVHCQLLDGVGTTSEYRVKLAGLPPIQGNAERVREIRSRSQQLLGRPWAEVQEEIWQRQHLGQRPVLTEQAEQTASTTRQARERAGTKQLPHPTGTIRRRSPQGPQVKE